jgi:hypothetical protein
MLLSEERDNTMTLTNEQQVQLDLSLLRTRIESIRGYLTKLPVKHSGQEQQRSLIAGLDVALKQIDDASKLLLPTDIEPITRKECPFCRVLVPTMPEQWTDAENDFYGTPVTIKNIPACDECHTTVKGVDGLRGDLFTLQPSAVFIHSERPHVEEAYIGITSDGRAIAVMHAVFEAAREDVPEQELYSPDEWVKHLDGEGVHLIGHYAEV